ncbi:28S ribosomal protein S26, mitochondrial isoform X2 [Hemicordylus capensis]|uniref:28S ribosomal protein S26, mitochondrial isoform X2 n=1 Tax=Hemicordylus capensis TaxID=884348 RepID=UPI002302D055|nr:28S ribosomal protein S26, mitochondrial isoform X2 [Hemicordylus capensis]
MVLVSDRAVPRPLPAPLPGMLRGLVPLPSRAALLGQAPLLAAAPSRGRKSRTDPPAKSKAGRIKVPPPVDPAELLVVTQRYERYRLVVRALRAEFREEMLRQQYEEKFGGVGRQRKEAVAEEHRKLMAWNDAENKRLQELREQMQCAFCVATSGRSASERKQQKKKSAARKRPNTRLPAWRSFLRRRRKKSSSCKKKPRPSSPLKTWRSGSRSA